MTRLALSLVAIGLMISAALALQTERASAGATLEDVKPGDRSITAHWKHTSTNWACAHVRVKEQGASNWLKVVTYPTTTGAHITAVQKVDGLVNGTPYVVEVEMYLGRSGQTCVGQSRGIAGPWPSAVTPAAVPAAPAKPTLTVGNQQLSVSWTKPANNGSAITGFKVQHSSDGATWTTITISGGSTRSTTITGLTNGTSYQVRVLATNAIGDSAESNSATATPQQNTQQPDSQQAAAAAVETPYEIVLRGAVERVSTEDDPDPLTLYFPTLFLSDCDDLKDEADPDCGSLTFPDGVYEGLDEAVSETVRKNIWGSYVVTDEVGTAQAWERRFRAWLDTERLGFELEGRRYFALSGRAVFDLDLWIIYYMAERGMNSVRLAERPFEPMLTVCLPRPRSADADAIVAVWDYQEWRWQPLESVVSADEGQICALTPFVTEFSLVERESTSELAQIP